MTTRSKLQQLRRPALFLMTFFVAVAMAVPARAEMEEYPVVKLQSLDKATARTMTFEVEVGSTVKFGPLYIKPRVCRKAPPIEKPEAASFLQVWELTSEEKAEWVFSGWMFASSPSLSSMDHPIYDVWVLDCLEKKSDTASTTEGTEDAASSEDGNGPATDDMEEDIPEEDNIENVNED